MLYDRWRQIAREQRNAIALRDLASGRAWTFAQLAAEAERGEIGDEPVLCPQGMSDNFILTVLRAWRENRVVCPLESGQPPPAAGSGGASANRIVHLKTTSATTGLSRLVAFTAAQIAADAGHVVVTMGLRPDWPNLGAISLAHSYGFSNLVTPLLLHGIPLILLPAPLPEAVRRAAALVPAITLPAVPALWRAWHDADAIPPNLKLAISAGAPLPLALEQEIFAKRGLKIHNFYGASECGGIAYDATETPRTDAACVGSPMKNVSLSVADDGCLEVRSRAVAEAYWEAGSGKPEAESPPGTEPGSPLGDGCFHTGDLAEIAGGLVYLRGRAGEHINVAGRKVPPETVERVLLRHPQVRECLVFGVPSRTAERTEEIVAVVVSHQGESFLRQFALEHLPAWQVPRHWWLVDALPANPRGKVSRAGWRAEFMRRPA